MTEIMTASGCDKCP